MEYSDSDLNAILALQFTIAWAGEADCDPPRLGWWRTDLVDEAGGGDLISRIFPRTKQWAALEAVRKAAILADGEARRRMAEPDRVRTLFFWGFTLDEALQDQIWAHKKRGKRPDEVLPLPLDFQADFDREVVKEALRIPNRDVAFKVVPGGRELAETPPKSEVLQAKHLAAAFLPFSEEYPAPLFRVSSEPPKP
jgi:hypothetical protein